MEETTKIKQAKMVGWYDPTQLMDTARKTVISTIIGENADPRLVNAADADGEFFDYSKELTVDEQGKFKASAEDRKEIWIDYVSDVGDGWNSTYSVAYALAQKTLEVSGKKLGRGEILVFGGDEVYPTATSDSYEERLAVPYRMAFNASRNGSSADNLETETDLKKTPHVFALPGNHDWYDSLVAFQKLFCTHIFNRRTFAGAWRTRQERSYFALKLPQKWWFWGVDLQLSHNVDTKQLEYFESIAGKMEAGDKVILFVPEPYWVKAIKYEEMPEVAKQFREKEESIEKLEKFLESKQVEIKLYLAGDLHHYRRFESVDDRRIQKITAGGGGAFLHPTHDCVFDEIHRGFTFKTDYPSFKESRRMDWKNLYAFPWKNKTFGILTAGLYALLAFLIHGKVEGNFTWRKALTATINRCLDEPLAFIVVVLMVLGLIFFTDSNSKWYRRTAGAIHGITHLTAIFFLGWLGFLLMRWYIGYGDYNNLKYLSENAAYVNVVWFVCILLVCGIGGYIIGSIIMGVYLFVSLHIFKRHNNEAFSALKIEDYKNFLRLHIDAAGKLTIYPIKIEKVSREWTPDEVKDTFHPNSELKPELIEEIVPID